MISQGEIAIDARWLVGGIGSYTRSLVEGLAARGRGVRVIASHEHAPGFAAVARRVAVDSAPIYGLREQFTIPLRARGCALLHVPHFNVPLLYSGKLVVTLHDLILISETPYRETLGSRLYAAPMLRLAVRKADHVITVSEASRRKILETLGVPACKVSVIPNAAKPVFAPRDPLEAKRRLEALAGISGACLLYVGNFKPHKNVDTLLRALALAGGRSTARRLLLVGGTDREYAPVARRVEELGLSEAVRRLRRVSDEELAWIYCAADVLVMPSRSEGFGLPVLEAMASGTPVLSARTDALVEVAGDAARFFDPSNHEELAAAIDALLSSPPLQRALAGKGLERSRLFRRQAFIDRHVEIYDRLLEEARVPQSLSEKDRELAGNQPT